MKQLIIIAGFLGLTSGFVSCGGAHGNDPGEAYMPDMYYARAYETYGYNNVGGEYDSLKKRGIYYNGLPVPGTVARGEMMSYHLTNDSTGLQSAEGYKNPLDSMAATKGAMKDAERLYLVNCGICHGVALDGNGPILASGGYPGVPANFKAPNIISLSDGHYFHVVTFGIRTMGSYASQLTPEQRWWVIKYIRLKQATGGKAVVGDSSQAVIKALPAGDMIDSTKK
jgi:mono/diheme cytochrome c family protein